jgi:hypothetical protein
MDHADRPSFSHRVQHLKTTWEEVRQQSALSKRNDL